MGWKNDLGLILFGGMILSFTNFVLVSNILLQGVNKKQVCSCVDPISLQALMSFSSLFNTCNSV
jgi:hypothetical protein